MQSQGVGLVVIDGLEAPLTGDLQHHILARVALACPVLLDDARGDGGVRHAVRLTPSREGGQEAAVDVTSGH